MPCTPCLQQGRICETKVDHKRHSDFLERNGGDFWRKALTDFEQNIFHLPTAPSPVIPDEQPNPTSCDDGRVLAMDSVPCFDSKIIDDAESESCFETFCEYVYPQYPFLHLPTLRSQFEAKSKFAQLSSSPDIENDEDRLAFSQILICLSIGRLCQCTYTHSAKACYPGGWGLYSAAVRIQPSLMVSGNASEALLLSQSIMLMVCFTLQLLKALHFEGLKKLTSATHR